MLSKRIVSWYIHESLGLKLKEREICFVAGSVSQWPKWLRRQYGKLEICGSSPDYDTNFSLKNYQPGILWQAHRELGPQKTPSCPYCKFLYCATTWIKNCIRNCDQRQLDWVHGVKILRRMWWTLELHTKSRFPIDTSCLIATWNRHELVAERLTKDVFIIIIIIIIHCYLETLQHLWSYRV